MPDLPTIASPPPPPPPTHVHCLRCEYDLRGIPRDANCPECGTPAASSWERSEVELAGRLPPLHLSSTSWLRAMGLACCVMIISMLLTGIDALRMVSGATTEGVNVLSAAVGLSNLAAKGIGLWLFGAREPLRSPARGAGSAGDRASRYAIRAAALASVALPFAMVAVMSRFATVPRFFDAVTVVAALLA